MKQGEVSIYRLEFEQKLFLLLRSLPQILLKWLLPCDTVGVPHSHILSNDATFKTTFTPQCRDLKIIYIRFG